MEAKLAAAEALRKRLEEERRIRYLEEQEQLIKFKTLEEENLK